MIIGDVGDSTLHHAIANKLADMGVEHHFVAPEEAERERGLTFSRDHFTLHPEPIESPNMEVFQEMLTQSKNFSSISNVDFEKFATYELEPSPTYFKPPATRRERRAAARKKR